MNNILVTGNLGYIGSVLTEELKSIGYNVVGFDIGYFKDCLIAKETNPHKQIIKDLRDIDKYDLDVIDGIIHLAGLSNDPLGELKKKLHVIQTTAAVVAAGFDAAEDDTLGGIRDVA